MSTLAKFTPTRPLSQFKVHSNDLFSRTTASMNLKFHMQHDKTPRLQKHKI